MGMGYQGTYGMDTVLWDFSWMVSLCPRASPDGLAAPCPVWWGKGGPVRGRGFSADMSDVTLVWFVQKTLQLRRLALAGAGALAATASAAVAAYVLSAPRVRFRAADIPRLKRSGSTVRVYPQHTFAASAGCMHVRVCVCVRV
jgi:hypothetical protein